MRQRVPQSDFHICKPALILTLRNAGEESRGCDDCRKSNQFLATHPKWDYKSRSYQK
jgi:hypothetical protein